VTSEPESLLIPGTQASQLEASGHREREDSTRCVDLGVWVNKEVFCGPEKKTDVRNREARLSDRTGPKTENTATMMPRLFVDRWTSTDAVRVLNCPIARSTLKSKRTVFRST